MVITDEWEGHSPSISTNWTYDTSTRRASVTWQCGPGYFRYHFFKFYVFLRHQNSDDTYSTKYQEIFSLENTGWPYVDIWSDKTSKSYSIVLPVDYVKGETEIAFGIYCSAVEDGGTCTSGLGAGPIEVTGYNKLAFNSSIPTAFVQWAYRRTNPITGTKFTSVSKFIDEFRIHWSVPEGTNIKKMAMRIYENNNSSNASWVYSIDNPKTYDGDGVSSENVPITKCKHGNEELTLYPFTWYKVRVAVATATENIKTKWKKDSVTIKVRTREEAPAIAFTLNGAATTSAKINWVASYPIIGSRAQMYNVGYKLHDDTTGKDITTSGVALAADDSHQVSSGTFTVTGLTIGHTYTITPNAGSTILDGVSYDKSKSTGCTFNALTDPTLDKVWNMSDDSLVFGEPNDRPSINVRVGTAPKGVWIMSVDIGIKPKDTALWALVVPNISIGDNKITLSDEVLDYIYKNINPSSSFKLYVKLTYTSLDGTISGHITKSYTMQFKGNMKTAKTGVGENSSVKRAKVWVGVNGTPRRAIVWVGVNGTPRRTI